MPFRGFLDNGEAWDGLEAVEGGHPHQTTLLRNALVVICIVVVIVCKKTTTMDDDDGSNDDRHRADDNDDDDDDDEEEEEDDEDYIPNADLDHQASDDDDYDDNNYIPAAMRGGMPTLTIAKRKAVNDAFVKLFVYEYPLTHLTMMQLTTRTTTIRHLPRGVGGNCTSGRYYRRYSASAYAQNSRSDQLMTKILEFVGDNATQEARCSRDQEICGRGDTRGESCYHARHVGGHK
jgi:hypothetical protein